MGETSYHPDSVFYPDGASRSQSAVLLLGTAEEFGIAPRTVKAVKGGFWITQDLADILAKDLAEQDSSSEAASAPKKASGNRAGKKNSTATGTNKE